MDPKLDHWKIHQAKFSIENIVNFVRQWYNVELLIVHTIFEQQYNALTRIESTVDLDLSSIEYIPQIYGWSAYIGAPRIHGCSAYIGLVIQPIYASTNIYHRYMDLCTYIESIADMNDVWQTSCGRHAAYDC